MKTKKSRPFKLRCHYTSLKIAKGKTERGFPTVEAALHHARCLRFTSDFKYFEVWQRKTFITKLDTLALNYKY